MPTRGDVCNCTIIHDEVVAAAAEELPADEDVYTLADFFKVFGDASRVKLLLALDRHEMCVCDLAALLNVTKSAVSHQLRTLRQNNLVTFRREGKIVYYSLADSHVQSILLQGLEHIATPKMEKGLS